MDFVRTPDERFAALPGFAHAPRYAEVPAGDGTTLRMAYVDEGPREARAVVMLHGEPSWSFLQEDAGEELGAIVARFVQG